jgi:hypothetical protein
VSNPKLATLVDAFNAGAINTALWNSVTGGAATLDTVNDLVILAQPTTSGATNTFASTNLYDATSSSIYAEVGPVANGGGHTNTIFKLYVDANDSIAIRLAGGVFEVTVQTSGTTVTTTLATYDANAHGWWRLREAAGVFYADVSADGLNWTSLFNVAYTWSATAMQFQFQTSASATEASGNYATLQHLNTMTGGPLNINWPTLADDWAPYWNSNGGDTPLDRYVSLASRIEGQSSVTRGKQYELDECRSGEAAAVLANTDGVLDPLNSAGPYFGHIMPYQPWRRRMMWPPSRNLLTQVIATAGDDGGVAAGPIPGGQSGIDVYSSTDSTGGSIVSTASAWQGSSVFQFAVPSGTVAPTRIVLSPQTGVDLTQEYAFQAQVRNITASTTLHVQAFIGFYTAGVTTAPTSYVYGSAVTLTGSTTAAWSQVTVTATPPSTAAGMVYGVAVQTTAAATCSIQVDGMQLEEAAVPSSWCCPGVWYGVWAGSTESWAATWDMGGVYGLVTPSGVDIMGALSQVTLTDPLTQEITNNNPRFLYELADPSGSVSASDTTGNYPGAPVTNSKYGAGSLVFGTSITAANPLTGEYTGSTGSVMTVSNPSPGTGFLGGATFLSLRQAGIVGPANVTVAWTRMCAFRYSAGSNPSSLAYMWSAFDPANGAGSVLHWALNSTGQFMVQMAGPTSGLLDFITGSGYADGNWHLAIVAYSASAATLTISVDGAFTYWLSFATNVVPTGLTSDNFGAYCDSLVGNGSTWNWDGDFSYVAEFPTALSTTAMTNIYTAWKSACAGESSDARYSRILRYAGYTGNSSLQTGLTLDMGPATDIAGSDALSCLQAVCDAENGQHFVDVDGTITFQSRGARYNAITPTYIFGEDVAAGEWPYEDAQLSLDPTQISNIVQVTQDSSNQVFTAQDATSQTDYFPRTLQRTINVVSALECQAAAQYLVSRYRQPATRIASMVLHPSANPAMWPVCLSLELGMRITVNRRPPSAPMISVPCFVEAINWVWDDQGEATVTLQCSPVDLTAYGVFTSFHTTLHTTISSGASSITINAGADNTNLAAAQLSTGQQLVLSQNLGTQETVTIKAVAATSPGWTTCVITLVSNTVNSHASGDIVCEPLPAGVTNPAQYDAVGQFDNCCFSY